MKNLNKPILGLAIAGLFAAMPASATIITVTGFAHTNPTTVHIQSVTPSTGMNVYAGGFNTNDGTNSFVSWCVDILQRTYFGQAVSNYTLMNAAAVSHIGASRADALGRLATQYLGQVTNGATSGAFQLAVWEIVYENPANAYTLGSGNFRAWNGSNGSVALANSWLSNLPSASTYSTSVWQSPTRQDLAVFTPVPEPTTLGLLGLGLLGLGLAKRRNRASA